MYKNFRAMGKLQLNKEKISELSKNHSSQIVGGGSTIRRFTCSWCTSGSEVTQEPGCPEPPNSIN